MNQEQREALEARLSALHQAGDMHDATVEALEGYGPEILGFLMAVMRNEQDACDVFSQFSEDLWRGLEGFRWQSSFRTWAYTLARNASHRFRRKHIRQRQRNVPLSQQRGLHDAALKVRTATLPFLRTEVKDRFAALRESLDPEDQTLLILRIDRKLSWRDISTVMVDEQDADDPKALRRKAATLRKRFERLKDRLREMAVEEGLIPEED